MKQVLLEMPWATNVICPYCKFKFGFDARLELWTIDPKQNRKNYEEFLKTRKMPLTCLKCGKNIVFDFGRQKTSTFEEEIAKATKDRKPSIKKYFNKALSLIKQKLQIGDSVIPEHLTFEKFVKVQTDKED